ncbi:MAG: MFS transporter [Pseudomonas sp.]|uniref:spinster family MFS transporter n=1 Tax=Pseudomonas abieticivorans TaxID=2931382 RepID=UPI0020BF04B5|nr:MFS transporter [Pseudomonas sp. PIA16]MDE1167760.1 MFS transporter [Pseudomonas sp.]
MSTQARGWRRHYTLFLLFMVSAVSLIDRQIMGIVIEPIKAEFHVTDTQIGLLTGLGFSLVYCLFAIPIGRFADRANRRNLIGLCCAGWSAMTLLCGCATSYWGLALARLGVAIGESGSGAASMSMIADLYPPHQRAKAISVFMLGAPIGALLGLSAGAWIAYDYGWRQAFVWVAVPGLVTAVLLRLSGWEPRRGTWESPTAGSTPHESLWPVLRGAWQCSPFVRIACAGALLAFSGYAFSIWSTAFLVRTHGLTLKDAGTLMGLVAGPGAIIGSLSSGWLTAHLGRRDSRWQLGVPIIGALLAFPMAAGFALYPAGSPWLLGALHIPRAAAFMFGMSVFGMWWMAPSYTAIAQLIAPARRATLIAVYNFGIMALGAGFGPLAVGVLSDHLGQLAGANALRWALVICASGYLLASAILLSVLKPYTQVAQETRLRFG